MTHVPKVAEFFISICIEIELLPSVVVFSWFVLVLESLFTFHGLSTQNFRPFRLLTKLKLSQNKKDPNDVTAALFSVVFLLLAAEKKTPKTGQL